MKLIFVVVEFSLGSLMIDRRMPPESDAQNFHTIGSGEIEPREVVRH